MFSIPKHGWVDISIGDWSDRSSYLTDPHLDMLDAFITLYGSYNPGAVYCDAEGWEYMIVLDHYAVHIIESKDSYKLYTIEKNIEDLAKECYYDILNNINEWSKWDTDEMTENEIKSNRAKIIRRLKQIRAIYMKRGTFL